jgi:exonuclease SbcC
MPLETLTLHDFQAHKKLVLQLDPRITSIVGSSDVGKSAVIRALRWLCQNTPDGIEFIRHGAKEAVVELEVEGRTIVRSRGKSENFYGMVADEFKAFGKGVPPEIAEVLRVEDINFQSQHDAPFWFSETSGEVSRRLNQIINLSDIDEVLAEVASEKRTAEQSAKLLEERVRTAKERKLSLVFVEDMDVKLRKLEAAEAELETFRGQVSDLRNAVRRATDAEAALEDARILSKEGATLLALATEVRDLEKDRVRLRALMDNLKALNKARKLTPPDMGVLVLLKTNAESIAATRDKLSRTIENLRTLYRDRRTKVDEAARLEKELKEKTGGVCPVCGGELK